MRPDRTAALQAQITGLREIADLLRALLNDALEQRDKWQAKVERLVLAAPEQKPPLLGWWAGCARPADGFRCVKFRGRSDIANLSCKYTVVAAAIP